jgi:hypothetical protein
MRYGFSRQYPIYRMVLLQEFEIGGGKMFFCEYSELSATLTG